MKDTLIHLTIGVISSFVSSLLSGNPAMSIILGAIALFGFLVVALMRLAELMCESPYQLSEG